MEIREVRLNLNTITAQAHGKESYCVKCGTSIFARYGARLIEN